MNKHLSSLKILRILTYIFTFIENLKPTYKQIKFNYTSYHKWSKK